MNVVCDDDALYFYFWLFPRPKNAVHLIYVQDQVIQSRDYYEPQTICIDTTSDT